MKFEEIDSIVGGVPYIAKRNARYLYDLILKERSTRILELGIAHGTATCYMAAALQELGRGQITAVDLVEALDFFRPTAEEQLTKTGLMSYVNIVRMQTGYSWFLHDEIARNTNAQNVCQEVYDLCIIDGPKNWTIDGGAFFLVDKLLKSNAWLVFDDYNWTYAQSDKTHAATDGITHRLLSQVEREVPHIREVFELLVKQHPHYGNLVLLDGMCWALAQKTKSAAKTYSIVYRHRRPSRFSRLTSKLGNVLRSVTGKTTEESVSRRDAA